MLSLVQFGDDAFTSGGGPGGGGFQRGGFGVSFTLDSKGETMSALRLLAAHGYKIHHISCCRMSIEAATQFALSCRGIRSRCSICFLATKERIKAKECTLSGLHKVEVVGQGILEVEVAVELVEVVGLEEAVGLEMVVEQEVVAVEEMPDSMSPTDM